MEERKIRGSNGHILYAVSPDRRLHCTALRQAPELRCRRCLRDRKYRRALNAVLLPHREVVAHLVSDGVHMHPRQHEEDCGEIRKPPLPAAFPRRLCTMRSGPRVWTVLTVESWVRSDPRHLVAGDYERQKSRLRCLGRFLPRFYKGREVLIAIFSQSHVGRSKRFLPFLVPWRRSMSRTSCPS